MDLKHFEYCNKNSISGLLKPRAGEMKLAERMGFGEGWQSSPARFVVLGIEESIGVKANLGIAGTHTAWKAFLQSFLNIQDTQKLSGDEIHLLGNFNFQVLDNPSASTEELRDLVQVMDEEIYPLIEQIVNAHKIPVIIGGSHANAYPIIKGLSKAKQQAINVINLDAHADFRALEGRHSGNPFSTAKAEGHLANYSILGLHENYNSQNMLDDMLKKKGIRYHSWEDIYLRKLLSFDEALADFLLNNQNSACGIELDIDSIAGILSSAVSPSGFTTTEARYYAYQCGHHLQASYFHICEGATELANGQKDPGTGKLLAYLVSDFVKGVLEK